jgi:hypothetical protein
MDAWLSQVDLKEVALILICIVFRVNSLGTGADH